MTSVTFDLAGRAVHLYSTDCLSLANLLPSDNIRLMWVPRPPTGMFDTCALLTRLMFESDSCHRLRELLSGESDVAVHRLDDHEVVAALAHLVIAGRLKVREQQPRPEAMSWFAARTNAERTHTDYAPALTPSRRANRVEADPPPARPVPEGRDFLARGLEQDAQAATLRRASASGTPFCELCEGAKRAAKHSAQQALA